jgi:hypothetical protein
MARRSFLLLLVVSTYLYVAVAQNKVRVPMPREIYVGRYSFIDIGPPFDYYEVVSLRSTASGVRVERVTVTPPGDTCFDSGSVTSSSTEIEGSMAQLLGNVNPCSIQQKELTREQKRCKHCLVFSGSDVLMQAACSGGTRRIRMDILDRDMFDPSAGTPKNTSWTMELMGRLDNALGSDNIMDKPIFLTSPSTPTAPSTTGSNLVSGVEAGDFDFLFPPQSDKVSTIAQKAKIRPNPPAVSIVGSLKPIPSKVVLPNYPPIARAAHVEGQVRATFTISEEGAASGLTIVDGPPMFRHFVEDAVNAWSFDRTDSGKVVEVSFQFRLNCGVSSHP